MLQSLHILQFNCKSIEYKTLVARFSNYRRHVCDALNVKQCAHCIIVLGIYLRINNQIINYFLTSRTSICPLLPNRDRTFAQPKCPSRDTYVVCKHVQ